MNEELKVLLQRIYENTLLASKSVLGIKDACLLTGLSKDRIYALCQKHKIPYYKQGKLYFKRADLEKWMLSNFHPIEQ